MEAKKKKTKAEIAAAKKAAEKARKEKAAALAYLVEHGFVTPDGKLAAQYR